MPSKKQANVRAFVDTAPKVVLVDGATLTRESLSGLIEASRDFHVQHVAAVSSLELLSHADVVVINTKTCGLTGGRTKQVINEVQEYAPDLPIFLVSEIDQSPEALLVAIALGIRGVFSGLENDRLLIAAIRLVALGGTFVPPNAVEECARRAFDKGP